MNFYRIQVFIDVVGLGSFSAVAKKMNVTSPAIIQNLKQLEGEVGFKLYSKINNRLMFTPRALSLYELVKRPIRDIEIGWNKVRTGEERVQISLMGPYTHLNEVIIPKIGKKLNDNKFSLEIKYGNSSMVNKQLLNGQLDIGLVSSPLSSKIVDCRLIHQEELVLVSRKRYVEKFMNNHSDINIDLVDMSRDLRLYSSWIDKNKRILKKNIEAKLIMRIESMEGIISVVKNSDVVSIIPKHLIDHLLENGELVNIFPYCNRYINNLYITKLNRRKNLDIDLVFNSL